MKKDPEDNFKILAEKRVTRALKDMKLIGNLSNRSNYRYTDAQVKKILKALKDAVRDCERRFATGGKDESETFKL